MKHDPAMTGNGGGGPRRRLIERTALLGVVAAVGAVVASAILFMMNPTEIPRSPLDPTELLQDASFEQPASVGAWTASVPNAFTTTVDARAHNLRRVGRLRGGTVSQDVLLTPVGGRPYRFSVWIRGTAAGGAAGETGASAGGDGAGVVRAQTACAAGEEIAESPFVATGRWTEFVATVQPVKGERCTLRVGVSVTSGPIDLDDATFGDAGLINGSFELGPATVSPESWTVDPGAAATVASDGAADGRRYVHIVTTSTGAGIRQDVPVDPSTEPLIGRAAVLLRAVSAPTKAIVEYREPCSTTVQRIAVTVSRQWQRVTVTQPKLVGEAVPSSLIKIDGVACAGQVAIVLPERGSSIDVDGAELRLRSYWPPEGSPSYRKVVRAQRRATDSAA